MGWANVGFHTLDLHYVVVAQRRYKTKQKMKVLSRNGPFRFCNNALTVPYVLLTDANATSFAQHDTKVTLRCGLMNCGFSIRCRSRYFLDSRLLFAVCGILRALPNSQK